MRFASPVDDRIDPFAGGADRGLGEAISDVFFIFFGGEVLFDLRKEVGIPAADSPKVGFPVFSLEGLRSIENLLKFGVVVRVDGEPLRLRLGELNSQPSSCHFPVGDDGAFRDIENTRRFLDREGSKEPKLRDLCMTPVEVRELD